MSEEDVRDRFLNTLDRVPVPERDYDAVLRRAKHLRMRHRLGRLIVASAAALGVVVPLALLLNLGQPGDGRQTPPPADAQDPVVAIGGIQIAIPEGWDGRIYHITGHPRPTIRIASFGLPEVDDFEASTARDLMDSDDVLLALVEYISCPCPTFDEPNTLPLALESRDFEEPFATSNGGPPQRKDVDEAHALARRTFELVLDGESRFFDLWVEFGQDPAPEGSVLAVNQLLSSMRIGAWVDSPQPDGHCNDQVSKDPDCPQTIWLMDVLSAAGFEVDDDPEEQTLIGREGDEISFYIWVRESDIPIEDYGFSVFLSVDGVPVYSGGGPPGTLVWRAQGLDVRVSAGPDGADQIPDEQGMVSLVRATLTVPIPQ